LNLIHQLHKDKYKNSNNISVRWRCVGFKKITNWVKVRE
jgi:hypothetical protein